MHLRLLQIVASLIVGLAAGGTAIAAFDLSPIQPALVTLRSTPLWFFLPLLPALPVAVLTMALLVGARVSHESTFRIALAMLPLFLAWVRIVLRPEPLPRFVPYDQSLWIHALIWAVALSMAILVLSPIIRNFMRTFISRFQFIHVNAPADDSSQPPRSHLWILGALAAIFVIVMATLGILRFQNYNAGVLDMGMYDQLHWSMIHYEWFRTTLFEHPWNANLHRFGYNYNAEHFMPILLLTTCFYWFYQSPVTLILIQAMGVGVAAFPLYFFALRVTKLPLLSLTIAAAWLLHPLVQQSILADFHPDTLVALFLFIAIYAFERRLPWLYAPALLLVMACKEDMALLTLVLGLYLLAIKPDRWQWGVATALAGALYFWGIATPIMQAAVTGSDEYYLRHISRFRPLMEPGDQPPQSLVGLAWLVLTNPDRPFALLSQVPRFAAVLKLLVPIGAICLFMPRAWIILVPALGAHIFSSWSMQAHMDLYHAAGILPWFLIATVYAVEWLQRPVTDGTPTFVAFIRRQVTTASLTLFLMLTVVLSFILQGHMPFCGQWSPSRFMKSAMHDETVDLVSRVDPEWRIAVTSTIGPHLSQRPHIYHLPDLPDDADYVVIDLNVSTFPLQRQQLADVMDQWIETGEWGIVYEHPGRHHAIFRRGVAVEEPTVINRRLQVPRRQVQDN